MVISFHFVYIYKFLFYYYICTEHHRIQTFSISHTILTHFHAFPLSIRFAYNLCRIVESMVLVSQAGDIYRHTIYE